MRESSSPTSDIWHLASSSLRNYANTLARPALRRANVIEEPWLHGNRGHHARVWYRREHGHLQRRQRRAAQAASLCESGSAGICRGGIEKARSKGRGAFKRKFF